MPSSLRKPRSCARLCLRHWRFALMSRYHALMSRTARPFITQNFTTQQRRRLDTLYRPSKRLHPYALRSRPTAPRPRIPASQSSRPETILPARSIHHQTMPARQTFLLMPARWRSRMHTVFEIYAASRDGTRIAARTFPVPLRLTPLRLTPRVCGRVASQAKSII